jgi:uncharacterized protein
VSLTPELAAAGIAQFVSLTTFRPSGAPVATPVWVARDGDALVVTTAVDTGKLRRLRHDPGSSCERAAVEARWLRA